MYLLSVDGDVTNTAVETSLNVVRIFQHDIEAWPHPAEEQRRGGRDTSATFILCRHELTRVVHRQFNPARATQ